MHRCLNDRQHLKKTRRSTDMEQRCRCFESLKVLDVDFLVERMTRQGLAAGVASFADGSEARRYAAPSRRRVRGAMRA